MASVKECKICKEPINSKRRVICDNHTDEEKEEFHKQRYMQKQSEAVSFIRSADPEVLLELVGYKNLEVPSSSLDGYVPKHDSLIEKSKKIAASISNRPDYHDNLIGPRNLDWAFNRHTRRFILYDHGIEVPKKVWKLIYKEGYVFLQVIESAGKVCYQLENDGEIIEVYE